MNIYYNFDHKFSNAVVVVGSFDGVHKGHKMLIDQLNSEADRVGGEAVLITFDPHPREVLGRGNKRLTTIQERIVLLREAGVRNLIVVNFTREFAATSAQEFAEGYLRDRVGAVAVLTGVGHTFGRNKEGVSNKYADYGLREICIERTLPISSTLVREELEQGDMQRVSEMLNSKLGYLVITPISSQYKLLPREDGEYLCSVGGDRAVLSGSEIANYQDNTEIYIEKEVKNL